MSFITFVLFYRNSLFGDERSNAKVSRLGSFTHRVLDQTQQHIIALRIAVVVNANLEWKRLSINLRIQQLLLL